MYLEWRVFGVSLSFALLCTYTIITLVYLTLYFVAVFPRLCEFLLAYLSCTAVPLIFILFASIIPIHSLVSLSLLHSHWNW